MIESCPICNKAHETGEGSFGGVPWKTCPEVPEGVQIPIEKVPVILYDANGERLVTYHYQLAGLSRATQYRDRTGATHTLWKDEEGNGNARIDFTMPS